MFNFFIFLEQKTAFKNFNQTYPKTFRYFISMDPLCRKNDKFLDIIFQWILFGKKNDNF